MHPLGAGHLADHIGRAELLADLPEGAVGHAGHRGERGGAFNFDFTDSQWITSGKKFMFHMQYLNRNLTMRQRFVVY